MSQFIRTEMLLGQNSTRHLSQCRVAVFGLGGVGSYTVEALARCGIGCLDLIDGDVVATSNINRQLYALHSTVGTPKTEVAKRRIADINPNAMVNCHYFFFDKTTADMLEFDSFDYVVDAIDTVTSKLLLAQICTEKSIPIISSMGTGNKLDATAFMVKDVFETEMCPLAKVMRRELRKRNINSLKVVYSEEVPRKPEPSDMLAECTQSRRSVPGSVAFVPSVAGLIIAGEVIKDLLGIKTK